MLVNFKHTINTLLSTIITLLYVRSPELTILHIEVSYPLANFKSFDFFPPSTMTPRLGSLGLV